MENPLSLHPLPESCLSHSVYTSSMEKISLLTLFVKSWRLSFACSRFYLFGLCIALPLASQLFFPLPHDSSDIMTLIPLIHSHFLFLSVFLIVICLSTIFGKSQLIPSLYKKIHPTNVETSNPSTKSLWKNFQKTILLELGFYFFLVCIFFVLSLPSITSFFLFKMISDTLIHLGFFAGILIFLLTFLIKEFSLFYYLLSPLRLLPAVERGSIFCMKRLSTTIFFLTTYFLFSLLFTFSLNLVMLGGVVLSQKLHLSESSTLVAFLISLPCLVWYAVFSQSLWLTFFLELATPKSTTPKESPLVVSNQVPESPTI